MKKIKTIGVVGAGQMGSGIAQVAAVSGYSVLLYDAFPGVAEKSGERIKASLDKLLAKGKLEHEKHDLPCRPSRWWIIWWMWPRQTWWWRPLWRRWS